MGTDLFGITPLGRLMNVAGVRELNEFLPEAKSIVVIGPHYLPQSEQGLQSLRGRLRFSLYALENPSLFLYVAS